MAESNQEFFIPGGDGKWSSMPLPDNLEDAHERIMALQIALNYYSDARSYDPDCMDNQLVVHEELMRDRGMRARIGRLSSTNKVFVEWCSWARQQNRTI